MTNGAMLNAFGASSLPNLDIAQIEGHNTSIKQVAMQSIGALDAAAEMEEDFSFCLDLGSDSEIQVAVNEIRKEAEKIDTILVLDQFKTLQTEFESMRNKYSTKTLENEDLKLRLQKSENRVAHMELERDLHLADAEKLREDLKTIVSKMFDISMYESSEPLCENMASINETTDPCHSKRRLGYLLPSTDMSKEGSNPMERHETNTTSSRRENIPVLGLIDQPRHTTCPLPQLTYPSLIHSEYNANGSYSSETDTTSLLPLSPECKPLRNQNIFRTRRNPEEPRRRTDSRWAKQQRNLPLRSDSTAEKKSEGINICRHESLSPVDTHSTSLVTEMYDEQEKTEKRSCGLIFRCRRKQQLFSEQDINVLKQQIYKLSERTKTSTATSEKLRKRLGVMRRQYEGVISTLQTNLEEAREEKARAEIDLANLAPQIDIERRMEQSNFEYEIRQKNKQIRRLKAMMDQGEI